MDNRTPLVAVAVDYVVVRFVGYMDTMMELVSWIVVVSGCIMSTVPVVDTAVDAVELAETVEMLCMGSYMALAHYLQTTCFHTSYVRLAVAAAVVVVDVDVTVVVVHGIENTVSTVSIASTVETMKLESVVELPVRQVNAVNFEWQVMAE